MEAALGASNPEAWLARLGGHDADADVHELAVGVGQFCGDAVGVLEVCFADALVEKTAVDGLGEAKEGVDLVDEMGSQVEDGAASLRNIQLTLPVDRGIGLVSVKVSVEFNDSAQSALFEEVFDRQEIRVPSSVLVHTDQSLLLLGNLNQLLRLRTGGDERLLGQNMLAGFQAGLGELKVVVWWCGDDHDVDFGVSKEVLVVVVVLEVRVVCWCRVAFLGTTLNNAVKFESRSKFDEGNVKNFGREAVKVS